MHLHILPSANARPAWPDCLDDPRWFEIEEGEDESFGELNERGEALAGWGAIRDLPWLDENSTAITAFAAYCLDGCDQEMPISESQTPYAIGRRGRTPTDVEIEIVGTMLQPQWEDRFDVGLDGDD